MKLWYVKSDVEALQDSGNTPCLCKDWLALFAEVERLQLEDIEYKTTVNCLRGLQKTGNDLQDDLQREWKKSRDEVEQLRAQLNTIRNVFLKHDNLMLKIKLEA